MVLSSNDLLSKFNSKPTTPLPPITPRLTPATIDHGNAFSYLSMKLLDTYAAGGTLMFLPKSLTVING